MEDFLAIFRLPELQMKLPKTCEECELVAFGFCSISYKEAIPNCVGILDG
jgi:hypothetical protein